MRHVSYAALVLLLATPAWAQAPATITVTSPTLKANEVVPIDHTADGKNESPALNWSGAPANTKQFALVYDDPDVVFGGQTFVHWVVYKIPGTATGLPANLPIDQVTLTGPPEIAGAIQGLSGFKRPFYRGPAPPPGKPHYYHFVVHALDTTIAVKPNEPPLTRAQLLEAMQGHVLGRGEIVAHYERK